MVIITKQIESELSRHFKNQTSVLIYPSILHNALYIRDNKNAILLPSFEAYGAWWWSTWKNEVT